MNLQRAQAVKNYPKLKEDRWSPLEQSESESEEVAKALRNLFEKNESARIYRNAIEE